MAAKTAALAEAFASAVGREPTFRVDDATAGKEAVTEIRKAQLATGLASVPGSGAKGGSEPIKRAREAAAAEMAVLSSGQLCSPALVHSAPAKPVQYMFVRPTYPYVAEIDAAAASRLVLQSPAHPRILDDQGRDVEPLRAAATQPSMSAVAGGSLAEGASVGGREALRRAIVEQKSADRGAASSAKRPKPASAPSPRETPDMSAGIGNGATEFGAKTGLQLAEAEAAAVAVGAHDARASGACSRDEIAMAQAEAAAEGAAELVELPRAPALAALDDYLTLVGNTYYQTPETGASSTGSASFTVLRRTVLGQLKSPLRRVTVMDKWSPYEVALFEAGICLVGKDFVSLDQIIPTKSAQDIMEFFYAWKKTKNYSRWKQTFRPPARA